MELGAQTFSAMPSREKQQKVFETVLAKYSEKKGGDTNKFEWKEMEGIFLRE